MFRIAVDAMGGDNAPKEIIYGINEYCSKFNNIKFIIYGNRNRILKFLKDNDNVQIVHTNEFITNDDEPVRSIRTKKNASIVLAAKAVRDGNADALFSLGSTGALLAASLFIIGRIPGIERPGLMPTMPTINPKCKAFNILDVGANIENRPNHLYQYAVMGSVYAKCVRGIKNPRVGLLNNGTEVHKGDEIHKEAYKLISSNKDINFIGNIESNNLLRGIADVVVTDGFTGNATLKAIEGTAMVIVESIKNELLNSGIREKIGAFLAKNSLKKVSSIFDVSSYGGAVLLGINAPVIKSHGSSNSKTVFYTIKQIDNMLSNKIIEKVIDYFNKYNIK